MTGQIPTKPIRCSAPLGQPGSTRALADVSGAAFASTLLHVPGTGTPQSGTPRASAESQLCGPTFNDNIDHLADREH